MKIKYTVFFVPFGWCGLVKGEKGLLKIFIPELEKKKLNCEIKLIYPSSVYSENFFSIEKSDIIRYFNGFRTEFSFMLDFSGSTLFQRNVWSVTSAIPYGEVRTYGWIADKIKNPEAVRAVGNALGKNPFPLAIPCHRVIKKSGAFGGFSGGTGTAMKARLLALEQYTCDKQV
jgi:O-6-methylguanine DNA methyltransferase